MYKAHQHKFICDVCGFELYSEKKRKRWDGLIVCPDDFESDHPQKYIRVEPDGQPVDDPRPEAEDVFEYVCYIYASMAYADIAEADCAKADNVGLSYAVARELKGLT